MAEPDRPPAELLATIHFNPAGFKQGLFQINTKTVFLTRGNCVIYQVAASRGSNSWTIRYTTNGAGGPGKLYSVRDQTGRQWAPLVVEQRWVDAGIT